MRAKREVGEREAEEVSSTESGRSSRRGTRTYLDGTGDDEKVVLGLVKAKVRADERDKGRREKKEREVGSVGTAPFRA